MALLELRPLWSGSLPPPLLPNSTGLIFVNVSLYWFVSVSFLIRVSTSQVKNAATYGAIGALIYSDPADYAPEGTGVNDTYPNTQWLPPTGVQRGSTFKGAGDPLTPGLPSLDGIYRIQQKDSELPTIPAHPISYGDAIHFLSNMTGNHVVLLI